MEYKPDDKIVEENVCPSCGGQMECRSLSGYDKNDMETEADWEECPKCGYIKV